MSGVKVIPIGKPRSVRQRLLESLGDILARQGFDGLTLDAVARESGLERAVLLRHFSSLEDMVTAFGQSPSFWPPVSELLAGVSGGFAAMPPQAQLALFFKATIKGILARPRTLDIMAWELLSRNRYSRLLEYPRVRCSLEFFESVTGDVPESLDLTAIVAVLGGAAMFLAVRSRQSGVFGGLNLYDDEDRDRVDKVLDQLVAGILRGAGDA
ncbi:transcriptional regulator, TetR family [Solidesulfovibrio fructosivorans JJ]]|uniref:Transcriptional regulator, TetR family n=1 Tax=Solidesulfovibrio fructosivorans JJ] TaxID=596151 RepID=E1JW46_SOLFR|nr:TetR/AcrR family transcriptional regulator [Solidesulfovibrio fructosivorans]EFL51406.1 transcriptional regulator, TetR family [Solidesulfovibrio fructosivorans JJ]]